jgi:hypothetical protein
MQASSRPNQQSPPTRVASHPLSLPPRSPSRRYCRSPPQPVFDRTTPRLCSTTKGVSPTLIFIPLNLTQFRGFDSISSRLPFHRGTWSSVRIRKLSLLVVNLSPPPSSLFLLTLSLSLTTFISLLITLSYPPLQPPHPVPLRSPPRRLTDLHAATRPTEAWD